ncbi:sequence-specific DNA binding transcription factor [Raphanus sativus]|nr:sequence-specific DNA binding transcription factor [Raphanus sativus]
MSKMLVQPVGQKRALDVFRVLQKHFPIKRSPMRLRLTVPVCEMEPGLFRECDSLVRNMQGRLEILAVSVHAEGDTSMDHYDEHDDMALQTNKPLLPTESETDPVVELSKKMQKQEMGTGTEGEGKGTRCSTSNTFVGEAKQYREHCESDLHKHNGSNW